MLNVQREIKTMKKIIYVILAALSFGHATLSQAYTMVTLDRDDYKFLNGLVTQANSDAETATEGYKKPTLIENWRYHISLKYNSNSREDNKKVTILRKNLEKVSFCVTGLKRLGKGGDSSIAFTVKPICSDEMVWEEVKSLFTSSLLHITVANIYGNSESSFSKFYSELKNQLGKYDKKARTISPYDVKTK